MVEKLSANGEVVHVGVMITALIAEISKGGKVVDEDAI